MRSNENGAGELATIIAITIILLIAAHQSSLFLSMSTLMRDALHAERTEERSKSKSIQKLQAYAPQTQTEVRCLSTTDRIGFVTRNISLCVKKPPPLDALIGAFDFHSIFFGATQCPTRTGASSLIRRVPVSRYECVGTSAKTESPFIVRGELIDNGIFEIKGANGHALLAATGTISINTLMLKEDATLVSLGDVDLHAVVSDTATSRELSIIAPLGEIVIGDIAPVISIRHWSREAIIPDTVPTIPWVNPPPLPLLPVVIIGSLNKPLGAAP